RPYVAAGGRPGAGSERPPQNRFHRLPLGLQAGGYGHLQTPAFLAELFRRSDGLEGSQPLSGLQCHGRSVPTQTTIAVPAYPVERDRKSTRLNSSHVSISY